VVDLLETVRLWLTATGCKRGRRSRCNSFELSPRAKARETAAVRNLLNRELWLGSFVENNAECYRLTICTSRLLEAPGQILLPDCKRYSPRWPIMLCASAPTKLPRIGASFRSIPAREVQESWARSRYGPSLISKSIRQRGLPRMRGFGARRPVPRRPWLASSVHTVAAICSDLS